MSQAAPPVDTGKVAGRRILHFDSIDQALADVDRLVEAERAGRLKHLGNWSLGQTFNHLAVWAEYAFTPAPMKVPFFIKWILKLQRNKFLKGPMKPGVRIPGLKEGTLATEPAPLEPALDRLKKAMTRLKNEAPTEPSPALGPLTHQEGIAINLRHAELHLGFHVPE